MRYLKFIIFLVCFFSLSEIYSQISYKVKGHVDGLENQMVAMVIAHGNEFTFETTKSRKSNFQFSGEIDQAKWVQLFTVDDGPEMKLNRKFAEFILDTTSVTISGSMDNHSDLQIKASIMNEVALEYFQKDEILNNQWSALNKQRVDFLEISDSIHADSVRLLMNEILVDEKIPLLKTFVVDNSDHLISAMVPHFVSFARILKPIDYSEMYECLDEQIKNSSFGRSMLEKALVL